MEKFVETERITQAGGQKASRTRKSSGAVANFGVSGYFSHEKGGTWTTSRMLPSKPALSLFLQTCKVDITWPERKAPTHLHANQYGHAAIAGSQGSAVDRGAAEVDREPADVD